MIKVLVIDDELAIRKLLSTALSGYGFHVDCAETGRLGLTEAATRRPDVILLDLGLPDMSGADVLKSLRDWYTGGTLILSVTDDEQTIVQLLDSGADDYITKPFGVPELVARIKVCHRLRSRTQANDATSVWKHGRIEVDFTKRLCFVDGKEIKLTGTEYDVFTYLIQNRGKILTHAQILRAIWGPNAGEHKQYLRVYVQHLRQKIEVISSEPQLILTETGIGYRLNA